MSQPLMLLLLIALAWLAVMIVVVAVCQAAARGDAGPPSDERGQPGTMRDEGVVVWVESATRGRRARAAAHGSRAGARTHQSRGTGTGRRRITAPGGR
jgi:hypothetical protein